jgi:hypothetical protein
MAPAYHYSKPVLVFSFCLYFSLFSFSSRTSFHFFFFFFFYLFLFLLLCSCTVENTQKSEEQRQRKGGLRWRAAVASTFFWVFFSFLMQLKRKREFLVCLQEQREFEGISAAFKRSDAADFLFFFYYEEPRNEEFEGFAFLHLLKKREDGLQIGTRTERRWRLFWFLY